jgi:hypothetical protein
MNIVFWQMILAVIENGFLAGVSFDVALVKLPTRKRIGPVAYAQFARGNDLGNGRVVYPVLGVLALILVFAVTVTAWAEHEPAGIMTYLAIASVLTILHSLCTVKAAPIMLSLAKTPDEAGLLTQKLDRFAFWHTFRALLQGATFIVLVWTLVKVVGP